MNNDIETIVKDVIITLIHNTASEKSIRKSFEKHNHKIHFVPAQYRVLGGLIQSLNIKFGNFIEKLIALVIENDPNVIAMPESSKKIPLSMTPQTDALIDEYITSRQLPTSPDKCNDIFQELLENIIKFERNTNLPKQTIIKDIDALFRSGNQIIYLEVKYNDDHDTGKFVDINRRFIKTYAGLINYFKIDHLDDLSPFIYYFNPTKRWGPIYTPSTHIFRGSQLFEKYFQTDFFAIDTYLQNIGKDEKVIAIFDSLYHQIMSQQYL